MIPKHSRPGHVCTKIWEPVAFGQCSCIEYLGWATSPNLQIQRPLVPCRWSFSPPPGTSPISTCGRGAQLGVRNAGALQPLGVPKHLLASAPNLDGCSYHSIWVLFNIRVPLTRMVSFLNSHHMFLRTFHLDDLGPLRVTSGSKPQAVAENTLSYHQDTFCDPPPNKLFTP